MVLASTRAIMIKPNRTFISVGCMLIRGTSSMAFPFLAPAEAGRLGRYQSGQTFPEADVILIS
jgi:hypothetical protein